MLTYQQAKERASDLTPLLDDVRAHKMLRCMELVLEDTSPEAMDAFCATVSAMPAAAGGTLDSLVDVLHKTLLFTAACRPPFVSVT